MVQVVTSASTRVKRFRFSASVAPERIETSAFGFLGENAAETQLCADVRTGAAKLRASQAATALAERDLLGATRTASASTKVPYSPCAGHLLTTVWQASRPWRCPRVLKAWFIPPWDVTGI